MVICKNTKFRKYLEQLLPHKKQLNIRVTK